MSKAAGVIVAKAKAMHAGGLVQKQYEELLHKKSVSEIASFLKNETYFTQALKDVRENNIHRGQLENLLRREMFSKILKLYRYADASQQTLYRFHLEKIEMELILFRIRVLISQNYEDAIAELPIFLKDYTSFSLLALGKACTFDELLDVIRKTNYYDVLLPFRVTKKHESNIDYTAIETSLYRSYYHHVFQAIQKHTKGKNRKRMMEFFTIELDLSNITKIYRLKKFFNAREDVIRESLVFVDGYVPYARMEELISMKSGKDVLKKLEHGKYQLHVQEQQSEFIEDYTEHLMFHMAKKNFMYTQFVPLVFHSYVVLLKTEYENIVNIIEGVRYKVHIEDIQKELIYE